MDIWTFDVRNSELYNWFLIDLIGKSWVTISKCDLFSFTMLYVYYILYKI